MRKIWSAAEIAQVVAALATRDTEVVAAELGVTAKSLRGLMLRRGISIRRIRKPPAAERALGGCLARRSADAPAAIYGAAALAELPDRCCSWPIGDPSQADFEFCGAPRFSVLSSYCAAHHARAYEPLIAPRGGASPQIHYTAATARR
jgi:GcrA cell cycle regulator